MSDMITAEEAGKLLDDAEAMRVAVSGEHTDGTFHAANWSDKPHRVLYDCIEHVRTLARTVIALHAQLTDAKAAQALVVERADIDAALDAMEANMRADGQTPLYWREDLPPEDQDKLRACVRAGIAAALADTDGLALVQALRAERRMIVSHATMGGTDGEELSVNEISVRITALRNSLYQEAQAERDDALARLAAAEAQVAALREERDALETAREMLGGFWAEAIADRDRLAAANAALEAKLARLVGALEALRHAVCGETGFASCVRADSGKAYPWPALDEAEALVNAALAEMQARDEGAKP